MASLPLSPGCEEGSGSQEKDQQLGQFPAQQGHLYEWHIQRQRARASRLLRAGLFKALAEQQDEFALPWQS